MLMLNHKTYKFAELWLGNYYPLEGSWMVANEITWMTNFWEPYDYVPTTKYLFLFMDLIGDSHD